MLELIKGGISSKEDSVKKFKKGKMTNTRLMGAVYVYACWEVEGWEDVNVLHQFFHIDTEEYGIESYYSLWEDDEDEIMNLEAEVSGFLGGDFISINERELIYTIKKAVELNKESKTPIEGSVQELFFMLDREYPNIDEKKLIRKQSEEIYSENQLINYFVMRCLGKDFKVAETLYEGEFPIELFKDIPITTMQRNRVISLDEEGRVYRCETLGDARAGYKMYNFLIEISDLKVVNIEIIGEMKVTSVEAAFILTSQEYIVAYRLKETEESLKVDVPISFRRTVNRYLNGTLIVFYSEHNDHVANEIFNIRDDMLGGILISHQYELVVSAPTKEMADAFASVASCIGEENVIGTEKYHLNRSIMLDFAQSEGYFFADYLEEWEEL